MSFALPALESGAACRIFVWDLGVDELWKRLHARNMTGEIPHVARQQLEAWAPYFEMPTAAELSLHDEVVWIRPES